MKETVRVVCIHEHGVPHEVVRVENWPMPDVQPSETLVLMKAAPINPADLNVLEGTYPIRPDLPGVVGNEGVGVVAKKGVAVADIHVGQQVICPSRIGHWCDAYVANAKALIPVPPSIPVEQAAMVSVNLPTAWRMLEDFVTLNRGDWILQNAANSGVGRCVIQLAKHRGIKTLNVVRRKELIPELDELGATVVVTDEEPIGKTVQNLTGGAPVMLGLNAIGGKSASNVAKALSPGGTLVTYGAMSREPLQISNGLLIFKDIHFRGFWISGWYQHASERDVKSMYSKLWPLVQGAGLNVKVEKTYPLEEAADAVKHASQESREGKILFVMN